MESAATMRPIEANDLPVHLTHFVGRSREIDELVRLLPSMRMLTLTGAGGSGKSRLAREVATRAASSFEGVAWVDFAPLTDAAQVPEQAVAALRLPERPGATSVQLLLSELGDRPLLLVFDNCEHLVDACAELANAVLRGCRAVSILATSREALGVPSETSWLVPSLASDEAAQLFAERAQGALSTFRVTPANAPTVREICRRLDGLPLAIELAAARVRALSPEQIAERLNDAFRLLSAGSRTALPRHRTLRGVIDWSYSLLTRSEQVLLGRLAVFSGSFSLDAVEEVCAGDPLEDGDILDGVAALVEKSLVVMEAGERIARYRLLETVRQYGTEQLAAAGDADLRRERHASHYLALVERASPSLVGGEHEVGLLARVAADADNLRSACAWSLGDPSRADTALRLAGALFWFWYGTGHFHEARHFLDAALATCEQGTPRSCARALLSGGLLALAQGSYDESRALLERSASLAAEVGDRTTKGIALAKLGAANLMLGDAHRAGQLMSEVEALADDLPPIVHIFNDFWGGWSLLARGDLEAARARFEDGARRGTALQHPTTTAHSRAMLGHVAVAQGRLDEAATLFAESLAKHVESGDVWGMSLDYDGMAALAAARGQYHRAVALLAGVDTLRERMGIALPAIARAQRDTLDRVVREGLGDDYRRLYADGRSRSIEELARLAMEVPVARPAAAGKDACAPDETRQTTARANGSATGDDARRAAAPSASTEPARLRVAALGPLHVAVGERVIEPSQWGSARPRELLVYLLMNPDSTKEQVGAAFWPEATTAQVRNNFHVTLHRLRRALGNPELVAMARDRYRVDPALLADFDAATFAAEVGAARAAVARGESGGVEALERAVALYRGDFLDGEPAGDWCLGPREQLQRMLVRALLDLGAAFGRQERHAKAAEAYQRVLARDGLHEEALRALMTSKAVQGDRVAALQVYERFAGRLRREHQASPSRETTAIFERLRESPPA